MSSSWERILDQKPTPLIDHLVAEAAKLIAADYVRWPLELETEAGTPEVLMPGAPPPSPAVYREATRLARWDLAHETEAYDDYVRNRRYLSEGIPEMDRALLLLLGRWLVEQLLSLGEHTQGRVNRKRKLDCLDQLAREANRLLGAG